MFYLFVLLIWIELSSEKIVYLHQEYNVQTYNVVHERNTMSLELYKRDIKGPQRASVYYLNQISKADISYATETMANKQVNFSSLLHKLTRLLDGN